MRLGLLAAITTATSTLTQFSVSSELPWSQNAESLFRKNMKKIYVDATEMTQEPLIDLLNADPIQQDIYITRAYVCVDAKNPPSQLDSLITLIQTAKSNTGLNSFDDECDYTREIEEDRITYTFEFRSTVAIT